MRYTSISLALLLPVLLSGSASPALAQHAGAGKRGKNIGAVQTKAPGKRDTLVAEPDHNQSNSTLSVYRIVEQMPAFPGDLSEFLFKNIRYPDSSAESGAEGRVVIEFIVRKDGSLTDARIVRHADKALEQEALRLISTMPRWKPGRNKGVPVDVLFTLPIIVELD